MKYIKLFEDVDQPDKYKIEWNDKIVYVDKKFDKQYLDYIFADFLDRGCVSMLDNYQSNKEGINYRYQLTIKFDDDIEDPEDIKKYAEQLKSDANDLEDCFGKVNDEYPNLHCELCFSKLDTLYVWIV